MQEKRRQTFVTNEVDSSSLQSLVGNFAPPVRADKMEGREHLVVPMVMITVGVHNGSNGPLLYPAEELSKFPESWNYRPIVVYHPEINGRGVSACDPVILSNRKVGVVMNTRFEDGKLKADAWIERSRADAVDERIMKAVEKGEMLELSTGLFTTAEKATGKFGGEDYVAVARNHHPDHLAILPDKKGACSIEDGAGFLRLNHAGSKALIALRDGKVSNEMSHGDLRQQLSAAIQSGKNKPVWVVDVFDTYLIYEAEDGKLFKQAYSVKKGTASLDGLPVEVVRETSYKVAGTVGNTASQGKETEEMDKQKVVDGLIKNGAWEESDRAFLMGLEEGQLKKLSAEPKKEETPTANAQPVVNTQKAETVEEKKEAQPAPKPASLEEYVRNAPAEIQQVLNDGLNSARKEKDDLVKIILANQKNVLSEDQLKSKGLEDLRALAALAKVEDKKDSVVVNWGGNGPVTKTESTKVTPLVAPVLNFGKK